MQMKNKIKFIYYIFFIISFSCCTSPNTKEQDSNSKTENLSAQEIYQRTVNNTVTVITNKGLGSGFFIDSNIIVTNYHVIEGANMAEVLLNNSDKKYFVIGYLAVDKINDLVLLQIEYKNNGFITMADNMPQPGIKVYAIGSPVGLTKTISDGLISGIRNFGTKKLLQITAPISHGSSGCPIINEHGKLVGVAVSGISEASNIGFCIPVSFIKTLLDFRQEYTSQLSSLKSSTGVNEIKTTEQPKVIAPSKRETITSSNSDIERISTYDELLISAIHKPENERIEIIEKCIQMEPFNYKGYRARALQKYQRGYYSGALADINYALQLNSNVADVYYLSGLIKEMLNDKIGMCADLKKAYEIASDNRYRDKYSEITYKVYRDKYFELCQ
jgi:hypothetical protein